MSQPYLVITTKLFTKIPAAVIFSLEKSLIKRVFKCHTVYPDSIGCRKNAESRAECGIAVGPIRILTVPRMQP